jgi:hypothetical protein
MAIAGYVKVGDPLDPSPHVHAPQFNLKVSGVELLAGARVLALRGVELEVAVERVTEAPLPRDVVGEIDLAALDLAPGVEHPLFITARQRDQSRVWSSPIFLTTID